MGIRIHKCIGYGFDDVETKDFEITDSRFNDLDFDRLEDKFNLKEWYEILKIRYAEEQKAFNADDDKEVPRIIPKTYRDLMFATTSVQDLIEKNKRVWVSDLVCHQVEYGCPNVVLFSPINFIHYNRYDDLIDYCEERGGSMEPKVNVLDFPIYPFESYMDKRSGEMISFNGYSWTKHHTGKDSVKVPKEFFKGNTIKTLGEARTNIAPSVPAEVAEFCDYMNIFKDKNTVFSLKPMIYTYWS